MKRIFTLLFPLIFGLVVSAAAQYTVEITGPATAVGNETKNYTLVWRNKNIIKPPPEGMVPIWFTDGGVVLSGNEYGASVQWTSVGTQILQFSNASFDNYYYDDLTVVVAVGPPTSPNTTYTTTQNCGATIIQRNSNSPAGVNWYWQTSSLGTDISNSTATINMSSSGNLYLRARNTASPNAWSSSSQLVGNIGVVTTPPSAPATATNGDIVSDTGGQVPLSVSTVSGATSYKWYLENSGGTAIQGPNGMSYSPTVTQTTTYYVQSITGNCPSTTRRSVTAYVHPAPVIQSTNNGVISMGVKVTLTVGYGYDSYQWKRDGINISGATGSTYQTNQPGSYSVQVSKGMATAAISAAKLIGLGLSGQNMNYIVSNTILRAGVSESDIDTLTIKSISQTIQYFDGLGRPIQSVITQGSPDKNDIVQPIAYDGFGRAPIKYLPYVSTDNNGRYKTNFLNKEHEDYDNSPQFLFYQNLTNVTTDLNPYAETILEASPLNRTLKQGAPGAVWQPTGSNQYDMAVDHTIKFEYTVNSDNEVLLWAYTYPDATNPFGKVNSGTSGLYYAAGQLFKNKTKDEEGNEVIEYIDKQGRTILKKVQADGIGTYAQTYYIYNDFGNLVCVVPPEATKRILQTSPSSEYFEKTDVQKNIFLTTWAFRYAYDARRRMTEKQVPGTGAVYMVYDKRNRLVLTQEGNQRTNKEWLFTKYDVLNRPIITGLYVHAGNDTAQSEMQNYVNSQMVAGNQFYEDYSNTATTTHGYTNRTFPSIVSAGSIVYTVTYYDNYSFVTNLSLGSAYNFVPNDISGQQTLNNTRLLGQVTGSKVNILNSTNYLWNVTYYDDKYRAIQTISQNTKAGTIRTTNVLDFPGRVVSTKRTYLVNGVSRNIKETFAYDHASRLKSVKHSTNGAADVMIAKNDYNEIGQLIDRQLHSTDFTIFKQSVDYRYNIRGWLTKMNESDITAIASGETLPDYFGMELAYNNTLTSVGATSQFNGNISAVKWSSGLDQGNKQQAYSYGYDPLNRLLNSNHYKNVASIWSADNSNQESGFSYDLNGNIKGLTRKGQLTTTLDNLSYGYTGNKLNYVHDTGDATKGFINGNTGTDDYSYDVNGNLTIDKNKGITAIAYNHLNLPRQVNKGATDYIVYTYDATGQKLSQQVFGATPKTTDYIGEFVYEGTSPVLKMINHAEGRVLPDGANWEYQYHLKDHLGNVRVTFTGKTPEVLSYIAGFETVDESDESNDFQDSYPPSGEIDSSPANATTGSNSELLNGGYSGRVGIAKSFAVMPGDQVQIQAYAKYAMPSETPENYDNFVASLLSAFSLSAPGIGEVGTASSSVSLFGGMEAALEGDIPQADPDDVKVFVTIILFDKDYNFLDVAYQVSSTSGALMSRSYTVKEPGYAYLYVSNEHPTLVNVYVDDVTMSHTPSAIVQMDDYYPFGLAFNSYQRENSTANQYLYNGKEQQDELGLGWYDYIARQYDPAIGRFLAVDPAAEAVRRWSTYSYAADNPIRFIDPDGMLFTDFIDENGNKTHVEDGSNAVFEIKKDANGFDQRKHYEFKEYDESQGGKNETNVETVIQEQQNYNLANEDLQQETDGTTYCNYATQNIMDAVGSATGKDITITGRGNDMAEKLQTDKRYKSVDQATAETTAAEGGLAVIAFRNFETRKDGSVRSGHLATFSVGDNIAKGKAANIGTAAYTGFQPEASSFFKAKDFATVKFYILKSNPQMQAPAVKQTVTKLSGICD